MDEFEGHMQRPNLPPKKDIGDEIEAQIQQEHLKNCRKAYEEWEKSRIKKGESIPPERIDDDEFYLAIGEYPNNILVTAEYIAYTIKKDPRNQKKSFTEEGLESIIVKNPTIFTELFRPIYRIDKPYFIEERIPPEGIVGFVHNHALKFSYPFLGASVPGTFGDKFGMAGLCGLLGIVMDIYFNYQLDRESDLKKGFPTMDTYQEVIAAKVIASTILFAGAYLLTYLK